jgi:hypothetical protein
MLRLAAPSGLALPQAGRSVPSILGFSMLFELFGFYDGTLNVPHVLTPHQHTKTTPITRKNQTNALATILLKLFFISYSLLTCYDTPRTKHVWAWSYSVPLLNFKPLA